MAAFGLTQQDEASSTSAAVQCYSGGDELAHSLLPQKPGDHKYPRRAVPFRTGREEREIHARSPDEGRPISGHEAACDQPVAGVRGLDDEAEGRMAAFESEAI